MDFVFRGLMLFFKRKKKRNVYILKLPCNFLFIIQTNWLFAQITVKKKTEKEKKEARNEVINLNLTSKEIKNTRVAKVVSRGIYDYHEPKTATTTTTKTKRAREFRLYSLNGAFNPVLCNES